MQGWASQVCGSSVLLKKLFPGHSHYEENLPLNLPINIAYPKLTQLAERAKNRIFLDSRMITNGSAQLCGLMGTFCHSGRAAMDGFIQNLAMGSSMHLSDSTGNQVVVKHLIAVLPKLILASSYLFLVSILLCLALVCLVLAMYSTSNLN